MTTTRLVLIVTSATVIVLTLLAGTAYWLREAYFTGNDARYARAAGGKFGLGRDSAACIDEAASQTKGTGVIGSIGVRIFFEECLKTAKMPDGFCQAGPAVWQGVNKKG